MQSNAADACVIIALVQNIMKKHRNSLDLLKIKENTQNSSDPFDDAEINPLASNADKTYLWELQILKRCVEIFVIIC